jgi:hypothetical protein
MWRSNHTEAFVEGSRSVKIVPVPEFTRNSPASAPPKPPGRGGHATIVALVSEADRRWFERHPDESIYVRPMIPGEIPGRIDPGQLDGWTLVRQIKPGFRLRRQIGRLICRRPFPPRLTVLVLQDGSIVRDVPIHEGGAA